LPPGYRGASIDDDEALMSRADDALYCWAHSGWVPDDAADPLQNFAELPTSNVYLRRELQSWTDSVKLRYGAGPDDAPALWARATEYTARTAAIFHGVRLDNCHSTPLHVATHVLRAARRVRPDLYVFAELFAGGEAATGRVANRLGLSATIEAALHAATASQLADRVRACSDAPLGAWVSRRTDWLRRRRRAASILYDQTHDDASPLQRRAAADPLPSAAVVAAAAAPVASNRGYDELVPRTISVITETRRYRAWRPDEPGAKSDVNVVDLETGLIAVKRALNDLHARLVLILHRQLPAILETTVDWLIAVKK